MEEGAPIDRYAFGNASYEGRLMDLLVELPREHWTERDEYGTTLLHFACMGHNVAAVVALLQSKFVDANARAEGGCTPAHYAAFYNLHTIMNLLCTAGADLRAIDGKGYSVIHDAFHSFEEGDETVRALVANGVRLSTVGRVDRHRITPELEAFERGVLRCRTAVVAMLRVKKAGELWQWDKFLLREVAYAVWATRYDDEWQN